MVNDNDTEINENIDEVQDKQEPIDIDELTDEEVNNLSPEAIQSLMNQEISENDPNTDINNEVKDESQNDNSEASQEPNEQQEKEETDNQSDDKLNVDIKTDSKQSPYKEDKTVEDLSKESTSEKDINKKSDDKSTKEKNEDVSEKKDEINNESNVEEALKFFKKLTAPFKANNKEMQIRSAEDAITLMQMGVNYSKRMEEIKPLKIQDAMLKKHGLNHPDKLSYLIDLASGKPEAIKKLLKDSNIDPLDINTSEDVKYQVSDHSPDVKQVEFEEAIQMTLSKPNGQELIKDINQSWDDVSKDNLFTSPSIFNNLLDQMNSGVYEQIKNELDYQRTLGHLQGVPFLQAYDQVGNAMQKAGVFNQTNDQSNNLGPLQSRTPNLNDNGERKVTKNLESEQPNPDPNLSANPKKVVSSNVGNQEIDYASMSDADFLKMKVPS